MTVFAKLKLVNSKQKSAASPIEVRRSKLVTKIDEQIQLVTAQSEGRSYAPTTVKSVVDPGTGQRSKVESVKRVKEWFWLGENGKINLSLRYGSKVLELAKGKNAIELSDKAELLETLGLIKSAVVAGELDAAIKTASEKLRAGFGK